MMKRVGMAFCTVLIGNFWLRVALADASKESEMDMSVANKQNMVVVLRADDIQHTVTYNNDDRSKEIGNEKKNILENEEKRSSMNNTIDTNTSSIPNTDNPNQVMPTLEGNDAKVGAPQVIRQTETIGTAETPTIDGGLISAPEFIQASPQGIDAITLIIMTKLNGTFRNSAAYDLTSLIRTAEAKSLRPLQQMKTKCIQVWHSWLKSAIATVKVNSSSNHRAIKAHKKVKKGVGDHGK
jgi:hypothetical protein